MKRSGFLKRKTPLKSKGFSQLKRTKLRAMSPKKQVWSKLYNQKKKEAHDFQHCAKCGMGDHKDRLQPHHHSGRVGHLLLEFIWLCGPCHEVIHAESKQSRSLGWLQNEFFGFPNDPNQPKPWIK